MPVGTHLRLICLDHNLQPNVLNLQHGVAHAPTRDAQQGAELLLVALSMTLIMVPMRPVRCWHPMATTHLATVADVVSHDLFAPRRANNKYT